MWNLTFLITGLIFALLIYIVYKSKEVLHNTENEVFNRILILTIILFVSEISLQLCTRLRGVEDISTIILSYLYLINLYLWFSTFTLYAFVTVLNKKDELKYKEKYKKAKIVVLCSQIIVSLAMISTKINLFYSDNSMYSYGPSVNILYVALMINMLVWLVIIIKNFKEIKKKKYYPIYIAIIFLLLCAILQHINPALLLASMVSLIVSYTIFFTIENPDVKMLNEMAKNKELMEQGYEDKYNFLFEMTQEARGPLVNINNLSNALRMEDDPKKIKDGLLTLNNMVRQLDFSINDILNISSLDVQKIKVVENKYELDKLCNDLEVRIKPEKKDGVDFHLTLPKQLPILYGDYLKIRQILYSLLINACRNTEKGSINMHVNVIEKYDVCRVVFNISDTGSGMPIEKINEILSATGSLDKNEMENLEKKEFNVKLCQKVVKIMGGNLMIKSNLGAGTDVILTIDQRVYHDEDKSILNQYENAIANYRKVLLVSQNKNALGIIKKKLADNKITYSNLYYGADAIDRIKAGKKFDFVIVDDEMKEMSGFMTMQGMQKIKGFDTPVIVMLKEDKEHIKDHYLEDGFADYILMSNLENELDRIIEKY